MEAYIRRFGPSNAIYDGKTRSLLQDDERDFDLRKAVFAGAFTEPGGSVMAAYQVYDEETNDARLILMDAPPQTLNHMIAAGQASQVDRVIFESLAPLSDAPGAQAEATIPVTDMEGRPIRDGDMKVRILRRSEQQGGDQYEIIVKMKGGIELPKVVGSLQEVADTYKNYVIELNGLSDA